MRPFSLICSIVLATAFAIVSPAHASNGKQGTTMVQRQPAKAKTPPWHLGWIIAKLKPAKPGKPGKPKPPACRG